MEVQFDNDKRTIQNPKTRVYSPSRVGRPQKELEDASMPIRPQYEAKEEETVSTRVRYQLSTMSKVLILLAVFVVALTALFALFGSAEYAEIITETSRVESDIAEYEEMMSQVLKDQSSMNDYSSINDVCVARGMTMVWLSDGKLSFEDDQPERTDENTPEEP